MTMKHRPFVVLRGTPWLILFVLPALLGGCGDPLKAPAGNELIGSGPGGGGGGLEVPGGGGRTTANLDMSYNNTLGMASVAGMYGEDVQPDKRGMRIVQLTQGDVPASEITTQSTLGLWEDGKFHIEGYNSTFNGTFANAGFTDTSILYYNQPFEGEFKFSARVRVVRAGGVSTGKGVHFGAYSALDSTWVYNQNPDGTDNLPIPYLAPDVDDVTGDEYQYFKALQASKGMGLLLRNDSSVNFRLYYSNQAASTVAGSGPIHADLNALKLSKEYVYEISRIKVTPSAANFNSPYEYRYRILDSKVYDNPVKNPLTGAEIPIVSVPVNTDSNGFHPYGGPGEMHPALRDKVYAGVCIMGSVVEVSQIKVWTPVEEGGNGMDWDYRVKDANDVYVGSGSEPIFKTPDTPPAYVPVVSIRHPGLDTGSLVPATSPVYDIMDEFNHGVGDPVYSYTTTGNWNTIIANGIKITPVFVPNFADENIGYELFPVAGEIHPAFGVAGENPVEYTYIDSDGVRQPLVVPLEVYRTVVITVDSTKTTAGETAIGRFKLVARDASLDLDTTNPEYSLLQTLPEVYFRVELRAR